MKMPFRKKERITVEQLERKLNEFIERYDCHNHYMKSPPTGPPYPSYQVRKTWEKSNLPVTAGHAEAEMNE
jgi:hypothetical protein